MANRSGIVKTSRGIMLDMNRLSKDNASVVAMSAGGVAMNARGDILGRGGRVIKTREDLEKAYNHANKKAAKHIAARPVSIKKTNISPDNLPEEKQLRKEELKKPVEQTQNSESFTLDDISKAFEKTDQRRKRKTTEED